MRFHLHRTLRPIVCLLLLASWLLAWGSAFAQTYPPLNGVVADTTGTLNATEINTAARELQNLGVKPLVVYADSYLGASSIDEFAQKAVAQYGYVDSNGIVDPYLFAIFVTTNPRQLLIKWGDSITNVMNPAPDGRGVGDKIRTQYLIPKLAANPTQAFVDSIHQAAVEINLFLHPPTPTLVPTVAPPNVTTVDTSGIGSALIWIVAAVIIGIALLILVPVIYRAYRRSQEAAARLRALDEQLAQARNVTADMITDLDFPANPQEQLQYRFVALALQNERPDQLAALNTQYAEIYHRVSDALARYNSLNTNTFATEQAKQDAIGQYQYVQGEINNASSFLKHLGDVSREVEKQSAAAPEEIDQGKKALAAATSSLARLAAAAPDLYKPRSEIALKPASSLLATAQEALQAQPPRPLKAYDAAMHATAVANGVLTCTQSLSDNYTALTGLRARVATLRKQGYKLPSADEPLDKTLASLSKAAQHLEQGDTAGFGEAVNKAASQSTQSSSDIESIVALRAANEKALADLRSQGEQVKSYIAEGATVFDQVDEYAESSWHDIRGNGTEAQSSADRAQALWEEASSLNSLVEDSAQDFNQAQSLIKESYARLDRARTLISAIIDRLKNIQESHRTAQTEITSAAHDIQIGQSFVQSYDRDITPHPAELLKTASSLLEEARKEATQPKPDWIAVVAKARSANDTADKALQEARSQHEAIEARRMKLDTLLQQAAASVSRVVNFATVHKSDITKDVLDAIDIAVQRLEQGKQMAAQLDKGKLEDVALSNAYDDAINVLVMDQGMADQAYTNAYNQFAALENLRVTLDSAVRSARHSIEKASEFIAYHNQAVGDYADSLLEQARSTMPVVREGANASTLNAYIAAANQAHSLADQAYNRAMSENDKYEEEQDRRRRDDGAEIAANIAIGVLGALLSSGSSSRSSGGGSSWGSGGSSWGSGGSSWGGGGSGGSSHSGGGSSGGGWGGGGSSGGSFGGGGSSGGSWGGGGSTSSGW